MVAIEEGSLSERRLGFAKSLDRWRTTPPLTSAFVNKSCGGGSLVFLQIPLPYPPFYLRFDRDHLRTAPDDHLTRVTKSFVPGTCARAAMRLIREKRVLGPHFQFVARWFWAAGDEFSHSKS